MGWAHDFVVKKHTVVQGNSKVRAVVARRIEFILVAGNENFLVVSLADLEHLHLTFTEFIGEGNLYLSYTLACLSNIFLLRLLQVERSCSGKTTKSHH